jgi:hypothetical protein
MNRMAHRYRVYGITVDSDTALALPEHGDGGLGHVECRHAPASTFLAARQRARGDSGADSWYQYAPLDDGSTYVRWDTVGEFLVAADGRSIAWRRIGEASLESVQVYMLGQALSFALVKQRFEPLHATAVTVGDCVVAFLGDNGSGKSSLASFFLAAGHRLVTDDLLVLEERSGRLLAYPGPPRIKLFPGIAKHLLGDMAERVRMNPDTDKLILPIDGQLTASAPLALGGIYTLARPRDVSRDGSIHVEPLTLRESVIELVKGTFNRRLVDPERLARQFDLATRFARRVSIRKISYPRTLDRLHEVRDRIVADLAPSPTMECASC